MTNKTIKEALTKAGYELEYKSGLGGRGWYIRKHGTTEYTFKGSMASVKADFADELFDDLGDFSQDEEVSLPDED